MIELCIFHVNKVGKLCSYKLKIEHYAAKRNMMQLNNEIEHHAVIKLNKKLWMQIAHLPIYNYIQ